MKSRSAIGAMIALSMIQAVSAFAAPNSDEWNAYNNPFYFSTSFSKTFDALPLNGSVPDDRIPWSDTYWPLNQGMVSFRWNSKNPQNFSYKSPTLAELRTMSPDQIAQLSPAEKFDIFMGDFTYPTVKQNRKVGDANTPSWRGICNGWAPASLHHREPKPTTVVSKDGIAIAFGTADIKAMLDFYYAWGPETQATQVGSRCNLPGFLGALTDGCKDINPGSFHIILANQLGVLHEGFVADVDQGPEVWNQPVYAFESKILETSYTLKDNVARGTTRRVLVSTKMTYSDENDPTWEPVAGTEDQANATEEYKYWLDLNAAGEIVGGEWLSRHPDFVWIKPKASFQGYYGAIKDIYIQSMGSI